MTCILLLRSGEFQSALEVLDHYDATRVTNNRGLTVTSQRKYVIFYELLGDNITVKAGISALCPDLRL